MEDFLLTVAMGFDLAGLAAVAVGHCFVPAAPQLSLEVLHRALAYAEAEDISN